MDDEPELFIVDPSDWPGATEWRERHEREKAVARARYLALVTAEVELLGDVQDPAGFAERLFEVLFVRRYEDGHECACSCHPHLPTSDHHDFGFACNCGLSPAERRERSATWRADLDAYWESAEGRAETARREAEEAELAVWVADHPGVEVSSHGGFAPEQWYGSVDGHRFYFRERHDEWRIELDLRPSGRFARVWVGGDLDGEAATGRRSLEFCGGIADGTTNAPDYGRTPTERAEFIVTMIRDHLRRIECQLHANGQLDLARQLGADPNFCPACGTKLR